MEQEQQPVDTPNIDPSIDPKILVEQYGDDAGRVAAAETSPGTIIESDDPARIGQPSEVVDGLPPIGAEGQARGMERELKNASEEDLKSGVSEAFADWNGNTAMTAEVSRRAIALQPDATEDEKIVIGAEAARNFRSELQPKFMPEEAIKAELGDDYQGSEHSSESRIRESAKKSVPDIASDNLKNQMVENAVDMYKEKQASEAEKPDFPKSEVLAGTEQTPPTPDHPIAPMHLMEKDREN
ncbi:MAG: hypothetical protein NTV39_03335 [Candidatus Saccharibacteria bacterium]|nr:hypothetical protein [Candidatus Saccharibacteria bacterium]